MTTILTICLLLPGAELPRGNNTIEVPHAAGKLEVFTYKPQSYRDGPMLLVFHGVLRNAEEYRDHAQGMGDRFGALVIAPRFPEAEFPLDVYQRGGVVVRGEVRPREIWTWQLIPKVVDDVRRREQRPDMPYYFIGHSGGGQFLVRLAGFMPTEAKRIVAANPGTHLFPSTDFRFPYGFGGLPDEHGNDEAMRQYLAQRLTLFLGTEDTDRDEHFDKSETADRQGESRWERGHNAFRAAQALAKRKGWTFGWRLVVADGVGHDHQLMFDSPACRAALFGPESPPNAATGGN